MFEERALDTGLHDRRGTKDEAARQFYLHHGFIGFSDSPMSLYIPLNGVSF